MADFTQQFPTIPGAMVDPGNGFPTVAWQRFFYNLWQRTGGARGNISTQFDLEFGSDPGDLLFRGALAWEAIPIGIQLQVLATIGGFPTWSNLSTLLNSVGNTRGQLLARGATAWTPLGIGAANSVLKSNATDPAWALLNGQSFSSVAAGTVFEGAGLGGGSGQPSFQARRYQLTAGVTFYVRTDGSDANTGLANSAAGAWATLQHAYDWIQANVDMAGFAVVVQIADGTYAAGASCVGPTIGGAVVFQGNVGTPANVVIDVSGTAGGLCFYSDWYARIGLTGVTMIGNAGCTQSIRFGSTAMGNVAFGATSGPQVYASRFGYAELAGNYTINGNATYHLQATHQGNIRVTGPGTGTVSGAPVFTDFVNTASLGDVTVTEGIGPFAYVGAATGRRFFGDSNSYIQWAGGTVVSFPGSVAGATQDGAGYWTVGLGTAPGWID